MELTLEILRLIASPYSKTTEPSITSMQAYVQYRYSKKNRMPLLYLDALNRKSNLHTLEPIYKQEQLRYLKTLTAITRVSLLLAKLDIKHAIFKTVRPYRSTTVDIDIIIFGGKDEQKLSLKTMIEAGYELVTCGPMSATLWDKELNIGIDLYEQVAVSSIIYIDKTKLAKYIRSMKLLDKEQIENLSPEADLACIIAHSIIKEQMYTLSEYYTFIHYLKQMNIDNFLQIVRQNNITSATRTHASITALLHKVAHKTIPEELQQIMERLGEENFETTRLIQKDFETPHKYHPITVAKSLLEIAKGNKTRNSMVTQIYQMLNPRFTKKFLKDIIQHVKRETY